MATEQGSTPSPDARVGSFKSILSWLPTWLAYALLAVGIFFLLFVAYQTYGFLKNFNEAVSILSDRYGVNSWLAKAIAIVFLGPLGWGLKKSIFGSREKRVGIRVATSVYACTYFLMMYWVSLHASFSHKTGETLQWYAETPEGVRFFDSPGYDPKYGTKLQPATPELKIALERRKLGQIPKEVDLDTFESLVLYDQLTGATRYWFGRTLSGDYALYDGPGFDPKTQTLLRPVTTDVAQDIRRSIHARQLQVAQAEEARKQEFASQESAQRLASLRKLFSCPEQGKKKVAMALRSKNDLTVSDAVTKHLGSYPRFRQNVETNFFRPSFFDGEYFNSAFSGDVSFLKEAGAFSCVNSIVMGEVSSSCGFIINGMMSCDVRLSYRILGESGARIATGTLASTGAGFDAQQATDAGAQVLAETRGEEFIRALTSR